VPSSGFTEPLPIYLTSTNGSVSGTVWIPADTNNICIANGCCGGPFSVINRSLTGIVDADNNLTLGSTVPNGGPVFTMTGTVSGGTLSDGSFTLTGSCAAQGTVTGTEYPALDGTYAGTLTSQTTGQSFAVSAILDQTAAPNSGGAFYINGAINFTGYPCLTSATAATPIDANSWFIGDSFWIYMNGAPGGNFNLSGTLLPDGKTFAVSYGFYLVGSSCSGDYGIGTLTLQ
jgi:hypothetical protein